MSQNALHSQDYRKTNKSVVNNYKLYTNEEIIQGHHYMKEIEHNVFFIVHFTDDINILYWNQIKCLFKR